MANNVHLLDPQIPSQHRAKSSKSLLALSLQLGQQGGDLSRARGSQGMSQGDGAALGVHLRSRVGICRGKNHGIKTGYKTGNFMAIYIGSFMGYFMGYLRKYWYKILKITFWIVGGEYKQQCDTWVCLKMECLPIYSMLFWQKYHEPWGVGSMFRQSSKYFNKVFSKQSGTTFWLVIKHG